MCIADDPFTLKVFELLLACLVNHAAIAYDFRAPDQFFGAPALHASGTSLSQWRSAKPVPLLTDNPILMILRNNGVPPALECRGLSKAYGAGRVLLASLDFSLDPGEFVAIMGDSGVGKSTLLNLIAGLDQADSGEVLIDGTAITSLDDNAATRLRRQKLGFVFQAFHVLPHLTLVQNVALPLLLNNTPPARALELLEAVGLGGRGDDFPRQLSGGELQRVAIARALVHRPTLILADEPTGNLDPETAHEVLSLFRAEIKANGAAAIMVTHSMAAAASADRILILSEHGLHAGEPAHSVGARQ